MAKYPEGTKLVDTTNGRGVPHTVQSRLSQDGPRERWVVPKSRRWICTHDDGCSTQAVAELLGTSRGLCAAHGGNEKLGPLAAVQGGEAAKPVGRFPPQAGDVWSLGGWLRVFTGERHVFRANSDIEGWVTHNEEGLGIGVGWCASEAFTDGTLTFVSYGTASPSPVAPTVQPVPVKPTRFSYDEDTHECPMCAAKPGSPTLCGRCLARRAECSTGIAAKRLAVEPWRPSVDPDHWIPDVGEHGTRRP